MQWAKDNDVINKVLFVPPPPTYKRKEFDNVMIWLGPKRERFPCLMLFPDPRVKYVLIYFHGNGCDLGGVHTLLRIITISLEIGILAVEYPGYGLSEGSPACESSVKNCGKLALEFVANDLKVPLERVIIFGTSIGTGVSCWLAKKVFEEKRKLGGLILQSPFTSIKALIKQMSIFKSSLTNFFAQVGSIFIADRFTNLQALKGVPFPLLVLHGADDELIPASHGKVIFDTSISRLKQLCIFPKVGHNNFDWNAVLLKMRSFINCVAENYGHRKKLEICIRYNRISSKLKGPSGNVEQWADERAKTGINPLNFFSFTCGTIFGSAIGITEALRPKTRKEETTTDILSKKVPSPPPISISRNPMGQVGTGRAFSFGCDADDDEDLEKDEIGSMKDNVRGLFQNTVDL